MAISFNGIPSNLRVPLFYMEFDNSSANKGTPAQDRKLLAIGQRATAGLINAGVPVRVTNADQAAQLFGRGSMLHGMLASIKAADRITETWVIALDDDAAGVAAAGSITFAGLATSAGVVNLYIGGTRVRAGVGSGDEPSDVAATLAAAINANTDLAVTAAVDGVDSAKLNLTCRWKGETGNDLDLRLNYYQGESLPAGLTATVTAMAGGAANPDVAGAITNFGDEWWNILVMPYTDTANLDALEAELLQRWGPLRQMEGLAFCAYRGTHGATGTFGSGRNGYLTTCMGTGASPTPPWIWAAVNAVIAEGSLSIDPARPLQTLVLPGVLPPASEDRWTMEERNLLLWDGISTYFVNAGGQVCIERQITTYQANAYGTQDPSYLDVTTPATEGWRRYSLKARITQKYGRHKLASDGTRFGPGQAIVTPSIIRAELLALFREHEEAGLVEDYEAYAESLVVERNVDNPNRLDVLERPDLVNGLTILAVQSQFVL
ncbi:phage tail sheath subtilisin-like domain-containing protein [Desulfocurvibacter africanus]|uniref:Bacteriophage Mu tail sheath n=1 Tax=Desulfocurvibacter africanus subsp. africanus str. Walvis Bay TaxID=690850 RepID=F3YW20_DESAF|nr:phage tail sheath subtilisin-like domain-containing protein [Desulfocurvibacter africanus]EGJ49050.1 bacteriophage Mu tail sheath [Desulfocurvibacter africanus subsp. africanus str. Walvis Bay]